MEPEIPLHFSQELIAVPVMRETNLVHDILPSLFQIHFNVIPHLGLIPYLSPLKSCMHFSSPYKGHMTLNLIFINFNIRILVGSVCKTRSSSLRSLLQPPANSTDQSCSGKANSSSVSQDIPRILWKPNVHYHIHNSPPPAHKSV
jgi:hypothetical protein